MHLRGALLSCLSMSCVLLFGNSVCARDTRYDHMSHSLYELDNVLHADDTDLKKFNKLGDHIIIEFFGCTNLNDLKNLEMKLRQAANAAGATVLSVTSHQFEPAGVTGVAVLQESHISVHTWPEYGYAAVDVFTCGQHVNIEKAFEVLKEFFGAKYVKRMRLDRGFCPTS